MPGDITFKFPLRKVNRGFPESHKTLQGATKENLKLLLLTQKGERLINPDIGTDVTKIYGELFEQTNKEEFAQKVKSEITNAANKYLPSVEITEVVVKDQDDDDSIAKSTLRVTIFYIIVGTEGFSDSITLNFS